MKCLTCIGPVQEACDAARARSCQRSVTSLNSPLAVAREEPPCSTQSNEVDTQGNIRCSLFGRRILECRDGVNGVTLVDRPTAERSAAGPDSPDASLSVVLPVNRSAVRRTAQGWRVRRLNRKLNKHRVVLARAWSEDTMHPSFRTTESPARPASVGQCGASSAWLLRRLSRSWRSQASYCFGDVYFGGGEHDVAEFHCWVEIGTESSAERLVIDLTFDQFDQFEMFRDRLVLCEPYRNLTAQSVEYKAVSRRSLEELRDDSVWKRLEVLDQATSRAWLKVFRGLRFRMMMTSRSRPLIAQHQISSGTAGSESTEATAA